MANRLMLNARLLYPVPVTFFIADLPLYFANGGVFDSAPVRHRRNVSANYTAGNMGLETIPSKF